MFAVFEKTRAHQKYRHAGDKDPSHSGLQKHIQSGDGRIKIFCIQKKMNSDDKKDGKNLQYINPGQPVFIGIIHKIIPFAKSSGNDQKHFFLPFLLHSVILPQW